MPVSTFTQPDYTNQLGSTYPTNIDSCVNVLAQIGQDFAPHAASSPNLTVLIDAGKIIKADGTLVSQNQQTATFVAPVSNPRIDRIVIDSLTGVYSIIAGTEAASPTAPAITAGKLPCAQVSLIVGQTQIANANITDERTAFANYDNRYLPSQAPEFAVAAGTDTYTATLSPAPAAYVTGGEYHITFTNANATTTPTLNINGLGAITIVKGGAAALVAGDIPAGHAGILRKTASNFVLMNPKTRVVYSTPLTAANSGSLTATPASSPIMATVDCGTVAVGDIVRVSGMVILTKDASAGRCEITSQRASGTAAVSVYGSTTHAIYRSFYVAASNNHRDHLFGEFVVTTGGTLLMETQLSSSVGDASVGVGNGRLYVCVVTPG